MGRTTFNISRHSPKEEAFIRRTLGLAEDAKLPAPRAESPWFRLWSGYRTRQPMTRARRNRQLSKFDRLLEHEDRRNWTKAKARRADQATWGSVDIEADSLYADCPGLSQLAKLNWDDCGVFPWEESGQPTVIVMRKPAKPAIISRKRVVLPPHLRDPDCAERPNRARYRRRPS